MSKTLFFILLFLASASFNCSSANKKSGIGNDQKIHKSFCLPPFGQFEEDGRVATSISSKGVSDYTKVLYQAKFKPFLCGEEKYSFRIMIGHGDFSPNGIQFVEKN